MICGRNMELEQVLGRSGFAIEYCGKDNFFPYERVQLSSGNMSGFLPMCFLLKEGQNLVSYDSTNCTTLKLYMADLKEKGLGRLPNERDTIELLRILMETLTNIEEGEDFLICFNRYELEVDNLFVQVNVGKPLICYIPVLETKKIPPMERILHFINEVGVLSESQTLQCMVKNVNDRARKENLGICGIINVLGTIRRDLAIACT